MQTLNQKKKINHRIIIKKSQKLIIGSFLVFIGILLLGWNSIVSLRDEVYSDLKLEMTSDLEETQSLITIPVANNVTDNSPTTNNSEVVNNAHSETINYNQYLGVLEIPKISLKRGFYGLDNKYNDIQYNVTLVRGSSLPDVNKGNLILMAHSGDAYISYFAFLYKLQIGDMAYVTYNNIKYAYKIVNIYNVPKVGKVTISRNYDKTTMTLITCTKDDDFSQTVYILEQV